MSMTEEVKVTRLLDGVTRLEHMDPGARRANIATNTYVIVNAERQALLVDASFGYLVQPLDDVLKGYVPLALALTHRHLVDNGGATVRHIAATYGIPVLLGAEDANTVRRYAPGFTFADPAKSEVLAAFDMTAINFPGHTEGSVMYYRASDGLLIAGDAAVGPTRQQSRDGDDRLTRPAITMNTSDDQLRSGWTAFNKPVQHLLPFHGEPFIGRKPEDLTRIMRTLVRPEPTRDLAGNA